MSLSVTGLAVDDVPVFKGEVLTVADLANLYPFLAEPFPQECVDRVEKEKSRLGYDVTGIGYQWIVNRFNEVLGPGHWGFIVEELQQETGTWGSNKTNYYSYVRITILLGNYNVDSNSIVPVCKPMSHIGGHTAATPHDAHAGAVSRGLKKTAALYGVGRQTYEHSLDEDLNGGGIPAPKESPKTNKQNNNKANTSNTTSNGNTQTNSAQATGNIYSGVVAIIDNPKFEQIREGFTKTSVKCKIMDENVEATLVGFNEDGLEVKEMGSGMRVKLNGVSRTHKEKFGIELKLKKGKFTTLQDEQSAAAAPTKVNDQQSSSEEIPPEPSTNENDVFTGQIILTGEPKMNNGKRKAAFVDVVIVEQDVDALLIGYDSMASELMSMNQGQVYDLVKAGYKIDNGEIKLSLKAGSYEKVS